VKVVKAVSRARPPASPPSPPFFRGLGEIVGRVVANPGATFAAFATFTAFARATAGDTRPAGAWPGAAFTAFTAFFGRGPENLVAFPRGPARQRGERGACLLVIGAEG
jgi:hypothetical protein